MKKIAAIIFVAGTCLSFDAQAWFFFFIPGAVTSKISDSMTGAEGDNCVGQQVQVGDAVRLSNGSLMTVKSLSGTSYRCTDPNLPIRALLELRTSPPTANASVSPISTVATTEARLDLPDTWEQKPLTDRMKAGRNVLFATNSTTDSSLLLATVRRSEIGDMATYAKTRRAMVATILEETVQSPVKQLTINGASAWQFEGSGKPRSGSPAPLSVGTPIVVLQTIYEGSQEIVIVNTWTIAANYPNQKAELQRIANSLTGIAPATVRESAANPTQSDVVNKLTVLKSLLDQGLITKDDYEAKKQALLKSM